jgi:hypothetical protein
MLTLCLIRVTTVGKERGQSVLCVLLRYSRFKQYKNIKWFYVIATMDSLCALVAVRIISFCCQQHTRVMFSCNVSEILLGIQPNLLLSTYFHEILPQFPRKSLQWHLNIYMRTDGRTFMTKPTPISILPCARAHKELFSALCNRSTECSLSSIVWIQPDTVNMTRASSTAIVPTPTKLIPCNIEVMNTSNCHQNEQQIFSLFLNWKVPILMQLCPHIKYACHPLRRLLLHSIECRYIHKCGEETGRKGADWECFRNGITDFHEFCLRQFSGLIALTDSFQYFMFELLNQQILLVNSAAL